jgi:hypothetical protein
MTVIDRMTSRPAMFVYLGVTSMIAVVAIVIALQANTNKPYRTLNVTDADIAIHGYDTVAYFTDNKATKGNAEFQQAWRDAKWHFASADNRDLFAANPDRYAPQYGGYCALGIAAGEVSDVNPKAFTIVDGKLYLNKEMEFRKIWREGTAAHIGNAEYNWKNNRKGMRNVLDCEKWPDCGFR